MSIAGPTTKTTDPSARTPMPLRQTYAALPTVLPHTAALAWLTAGEITPFSMTRSRFWRTAAMSEDGDPPGHASTRRWPSTVSTMDAAPWRRSAMFCPFCQ